MARRIANGVLKVFLAQQGILAVGIVVAVAGLDQVPPAVFLRFTAEQVPHLDPDLLDLLKALAILGNAGIALACGMGAALLWRAPAAMAPWGAVLLGTLQVTGWLADVPMGHSNLVANVVSTAVMGFGLWGALSLRASEADIG